MFSFCYGGLVLCSGDVQEMSASLSEATEGLVPAILSAAGSCFIPPKLIHGEKGIQAGRPQVGISLAPSLIPKESYSRNAAILPSRPKKSQLGSVRSRCTRECPGSYHRCLDVKGES